MDAVATDSNKEPVAVLICGPVSLTNETGFLFLDFPPLSKG
jgi:hypothetical protein